MSCDIAGSDQDRAGLGKWFNHGGLSLKEGQQTTLSLIPRIFAKDILPALGRQSIYEIKRP